MLTVRVERPELPLSVAEPEIVVRLDSVDGVYVWPALGVVTEADGLVPS
jgi:hypothetical protein